VVCESETTLLADVGTTYEEETLGGDDEPALSEDMVGSEDVADCGWEYEDVVVAIEIVLDVAVAGWTELDVVEVEAIVDDDDCPEHVYTTPEHVPRSV
jgi:hypothetical protein